MVRCFRLLACAALLAGMLLAPASARAEHAVRFSNGTPAEALRARLLLAPLNWLLSSLRFHWRAPEPPPGSAPIHEGEGWVAIDFPVSEEACGLFLEVAGRVEFDRAAIVRADGSAQLVDLHGAARGRGLYELASFPALEPVERVTLVARARCELAHVAVRLGR